MKKQSNNILILGSYGRGNVGDDVFLLAALQLFKGHRLYVNSADDAMLPEKPGNHFSTISTSGTKDIIKKLRMFWYVKHIVYCGGDLWVDLQGARWPRQSLYKMVMVNGLARLLGKQIFYIGCGVGQIRGYSLFLARLSARLASGIIVREKRSAGLLRLTDVEIAPDLAVHLPYYQPKLSVAGRPFTIGISLLYFVPHSKKNFPKLVAHLVRFITSLPKDSFKIILLPMLVSKQTPYDDRWACQQLLKQLPPGYNVEIFQTTRVKEMVQALANVDLLIGARLHANILATLSGTPCLGIAYRPKVAEFFNDNNVGEFCLDLQQLVLLEKTFWGIYNNYVPIAARFLEASKRNLSKRIIYQEFTQKHL